MPDLSLAYVITLTDLSQRFQLDDPVLCPIEARQVSRLGRRQNKDAATLKGPHHWM